MERELMREQALKAAAYQAWVIAARNAKPVDGRTLTTMLANRTGTGPVEAHILLEGHGTIMPIEACAFLGTPKFEDPDRYSGGY